MKELDLSYNNLQVIQVAVFNGLHNLERLNLANNQIHTFIQVNTINQVDNSDYEGNLE